MEELVGGVHALALLATTQAQVVALPAGVLTHSFDDKAATVSAGEEHTLCVTDGGVVYAWSSEQGIPILFMPEGMPAQYFIL